MAESRGVIDFRPDFIKLGTGGNTSAPDERHDMSKNLNQAREALEAIPNFFAWEHEATKNSASARIVASLGKDITSANGALLSTAQSLAKLSREKAKSESDQIALDSIVAVFTGAALLAKHFEKPAPAPKAEEVAPAPEAKAPKMKNPRTTKKAETTTAPEVGNALSAEQIQALTALLGSLAK